MKMNVIKTEMNSRIDFLASSNGFRSHCKENLTLILLHGASSACKIPYIACCPISSFKKSKDQNIIL
jgi:hypothetical protein